MSKKVLWVKDQVGILLDAAEVEESAYLGDSSTLIWDAIPGDKAPEIPEAIVWDGEKYEDIADMDRDDAQKYLDSLVGSESRLGREFEPVRDSLTFDLDYSLQAGFGSLADCETTKTYEYLCNSNWVTVTLDENDAEYETEILDTFNLDYIDYAAGRTNYEYGGIGNHAKLHKVIIDGDEKGLLWHEWSQWQGSELDSGELISTGEALERLENHPDLEEIKGWLSAE